jgi:hypothetical protein
MNWKGWFLSFCLSMVLPLVAEPQTSSPKPASPYDKAQSVVVPAQVAALIRPVLDELQKYRSEGGRDEHQLDEVFRDMTEKKGRFADEALVILMCFDMGESQEETDAVIAPGKRMLPYLKKYQDKNPKFLGRTYPNSMLKGFSSKSEAFEGAVRAINHGWHSTADNPEG